MKHILTVLSMLLAGRLLSKIIRANSTPAPVPEWDGIDDLEWE